MATKRYVPRNYRWFNKLLRASYGMWLKRFYKIRCRGEKLSWNLRPPYVLVANHVTMLDPFILSVFVREPIYWITADGNMRSRMMKALLRMVGSIPKSKAIPDIETVNWIVDVIRKRRGVVGIFPEGQATWDGRTLPMIPSTAKLLKLLKVPVLAAVIRGGFSSLPRWSWAARRGRIEVDFSVILTAAELKSLGVEEIGRRLDEALAHDESSWNRAAGTSFASARRAEHLEIPLFMCPACETIGALRSRRNRIACAACGRSVGIDEYSRFRSPSEGMPFFSTIPEWSDWQELAFDRFLERKSASDKPLFSDTGVRLLRGRKMAPLRLLASGTLVLFADRLELCGASGARQSYPLASIEGAGVLKHDLFEFYVGRDLYQARFSRRRSSALKWLKGIEKLERIRARDAAAEAGGVI